MPRPSQRDRAQGLLPAAATALLSTAPAGSQSKPPCSLPRTTLPSRRSPPEASSPAVTKPPAAAASGASKNRSRVAVRGHGRGGFPLVTRHARSRSQVPLDSPPRPRSRRLRRAATEVSPLACGLPPLLPCRAAPAVEMSWPVARRPSPVADGDGGLAPGAAGGASRRVRRIARRDGAPVAAKVPVAPPPTSPP